MLPQTGDGLALSIAVLVEPLLEEFICQESRLWESIHAAACFDVDGAVPRGLAVQIVLSYDFLRDVGELDPDVFLSLEGRLGVEVQDIHGHELCAGCGHDAVE